MSVPEAVLAAVVASIPGAALYDPQDPDFDPDDVLVFDGLVPPEPPRRYAVVYADTGTLNALAVCSVSDSATYRWQVTSVGRDALEARWIATQVKDGIVDDRLTADGWACGPIKHNYEGFPARDEQVMDRPVVYLIDDGSEDDLDGPVGHGSPPARFPWCQFGATLIAWQALTCDYPMTSTPDSESRRRPTTGHSTVRSSGCSNRH